MRELHAVELHLEQFVHRQLAARIREADDDAIDRPRADDGRNIFDGPDDGRRPESVVTERFRFDARLAAPSG